jgi:hypothetical protein
LAVANYLSGTVSVLLGTGAGAFGTKTDFTTGSGPMSVAIGDVSGDGRLDLAVANNGSATVSVLLGTGTGGFGAKTDFTTGSTPASVAIGDVNGDGRPDLAVANRGSNTVSVWLGNGAGGFGARTDYAAGTFSTFAAFGDVNGDGRSDLAVANHNANTVSVLLAFETTRTVLAASPNPAVLGMPVTLTATVSVPAPGSGVPSGTVSFFDGTTLLGTSPVSSGVAGLALFAPRLGARALSAVYSGDGKLFGSIADNRFQNVVASAAPDVTSILDIKADQGLQVRLKFAASGFDYLGSATPIINYYIYRKSAATKLVAPSGAETPMTGSEPDATSGEKALPGWDYVSAVPATTDGPYETVVPTLADSNATGIHRAVYFVRAATATLGVMYDSAPDSGYSVDNLPPAPPGGLVGAYLAGVTTLQWDAGLEPDLWYYRIYRGTTAAFVPNAGSLIATSQQLVYTDSGPVGGYYKLSAVDVNGNESGCAVLAPDATTGVPGAAVVQLRLYPNQPNPFNPLTTIRFDLPEAGRVRLAIYDLRGKLVRELVDGELPRGSQQAIWNGRDDAGRSVASGSYFARLQAGGALRTERMSLVK